MAKNKVFNILIADDEPLARDSVRELLKDVDDCSIIAESSNGQETLTKVLQKQPDIVFLDIQMPHLLGTEVVEKLSNEDSPVFIFVTAYDDQAIKAFELNVADYLLKPYSDERFYQSLNRAKKLLNNQSRSDEKTSEDYAQRLTIRSAGKIEFVKTDDIIFTKSSGNYVEIITTERKYLMRITLNEFEKALDPQEFVRIHRSTIVKKDQIKEMQSYFNGEQIVIMNSGENLKMSRSYKDSLDAIL